MPNAIIAADMTTIIGSIHLHYRPLREVENEVVVDGTTEDNVEDEEEDAVEDSRVLKEYQRMLL